MTMIRHAGTADAQAIAELHIASWRAAYAAELPLVETNAPARRFYERHGLRADGTRRVHDVAPGVALQEVRYAGDTRRPTG